MNRLQLDTLDGVIAATIVSMKWINSAFNGQEVTRVEEESFKTILNNLQKAKIAAENLLEKYKSEGEPK